MRLRWPKRRRYEEPSGLEAEFRRIYDDARRGGPGGSMDLPALHAFSHVAAEHNARMQALIGEIEAQQDAAGFDGLEATTRDHCAPDPNPDVGT